MSEFLARQFLSVITLCGYLSLAFGVSMTSQPEMPDQDFGLFNPVYGSPAKTNPNVAIETLNRSLAHYRIWHDKHSVTGANG